MARETSSDSSSRSPLPPGRVRPLDWARVAGVAEPVAREVEAFVRRRRRRRNAVVATALTFAVAVGFAWREAAPSRADDSGEAARRVAAVVEATTGTSVVSSPARRTLPDGSTVELKPGAEIAVEFGSGDAGFRRVRLIRGEAHFTVAKDETRPFVVSAGVVDVRAVGTAFSVQWGAAEVEVLVTAGRIALDKSAATDAPATESPRASVAAVTGAAPAVPPLAFVDAGSRAVVATEPAATTARVEPLSAAELSERLAWRVPRLEFNATPLAEVVALFNRHALPEADGRPVLRFTLAEEELGALPLSGMLRVDNTAVLLQIVESAYGIRAEHREGGEIVLRKGR